MIKPTIAFFSDANFLAITLIENLLSKGLRIIIFTNDKKDWLTKTSHITSTSKIEILSEKDLQNFLKLNYAIFINGVNKKDEGIENFLRLYKDPIFSGTKALTIFPLEQFDVGKNQLIPTSNNLATVYVGDLLGPRISLDAPLRINEVLNEAIQKRSITFGVGEVFYPIFISDLARELSRWIFSFGPYGKDTLILGSETSSSTLWLQIKKAIPELTVIYEEDFKQKLLPKGYEIKTINSNISQSLMETFRWIVQSQTKPKRIVERKQKIKKSNPNIRKLKIILLILIPILFLPYICLAFVSSMFYLSYERYLKGDSDTARNLLHLTRTPALVGRYESQVLKYIPVLGLIYEESEFVLSVAEKASPVMVNATYLIDDTKILFEKALGDEIYDPQNLTNGIKVQLDSMYTLVSEVEVVTKKASNENVYSARKLLETISIERVKKELLEGARIVSQLSQVLGKNGRKTYLVLFQNNMELRPTGGFIGSFGLLTFEGGRMTDFTLSDVYSADGQLKGHIEPPAPIKNYLGEASWFLRDSNWDPDFPTSALRAEWFLDKEIDKKVDGVIAIDLEPVRSMVGVIGPIYLADYNMDITKDNLYEKTQEEVHRDVFEGTHKKASFLTALSRNLVTELINIDSDKKALILSEFYKDLRSRHIQLFLHDENIQSSVSSLGWSGEVAIPACGNGCYPDLVSVIEANVGVNKANYFISRTEDLRVEILADKIKRDLTINIKNSANPNLGAQGKYKSYIRVVVPQNAEVNETYEVTEGKGKKEIGFLSEIVGGETKTIKVSWSTPRTTENSYGLYFRKQAGTPDTDILNVSVLAPDKRYSYNTLLDKDFITKITW